LTDSKLGAEGRKDLFDWLSRKLSGLSSFAEAAQLLKPSSSAMTVCSGYSVVFPLGPCHCETQLVLFHDVLVSFFMVLRLNPLMFARQQKLALTR
jgi:hypothetical protein